MLARRLVLAALFGLVPTVAACGDGSVSQVSLESTTTLPGTDGSDLEEALSSSGSPIVDELSTLFDALDLSGFDGVSDAEAVTVFAANDLAFTALDADLLSEIMADPDRLADLLANHVVTDTLMLDDLGSSATAVSGMTLTFDEVDGVPTVNGFEIVEADVPIDNGVVHVIDGVLVGDE